MARNAVHPYYHRNNEDRGYQQHQPLDAVFADAPALQPHGHSQAQSSGRCDTIPDEARQVGAASAGEIDQDDADDQGRFDPFAKRDKKCGKHG